MTTIIYQATQKPPQFKAVKWDGSNEAANAIARLLQFQTAANTGTDVDVSWTVGGSGELIVTVTADSSPLSPVTVPAGKWFFEDQVMRTDTEVELSFDLQPLQGFSNAAA